MGDTAFISSQGSLPGPEFVEAPRPTLCSCEKSCLGFSEDTLNVKETDGHTTVPVGSTYDEGHPEHAAYANNIVVLDKVAIWIPSPVASSDCTTAIVDKEHWRS